jgi:hypothetical protein
MTMSQMPTRTMQTETTLPSNRIYLELHYSAFFGLITFTYLVTHICYPQGRVIKLRVLMSDTSFVQTTEAQQDHNILKRGAGSPG